jgi:hypothetical protein
LESKQEAGHLKHLARLTGWDGAVGMYTAEVVASARSISTVVYRETICDRSVEVMCCWC